MSLFFSTLVLALFSHVCDAGLATLSSLVRAKLPGPSKRAPYCFRSFSCSARIKWTSPRGLLSYALRSARCLSCSALVLCLGQFRSLLCCSASPVVLYGLNVYLTRRFVMMNGHMCLGCPSGRAKRERTQSRGDWQIGGMRSRDK
ncbi:hypothetical protein BC834DRAFT_590690 [Gloeopeniophorella convolvens]|nr:hypothetical protein BC834DRAFT_590690 [Gloeopeniophorella convolvens]